VTLGVPTFIGDDVEALRDNTKTSCVHVLSVLPASVPGKWLHG
jgi:hypothetical protein